MWQKENAFTKCKHDIPLETYDDTGNVTSDHDTVFEKWSTDFSSLYNPENTEEHFDQQFYNEILRHKRLLEDSMLDPLYEENVSLNYTITRSEVEHIVYCAKNGKAVGPDKIPYEVLKHPVITDILHKLTFELTEA